VQALQPGDPIDVVAPPAPRAREVERGIRRSPDRLCPASPTRSSPARPPRGDDARRSASRDAFRSDAKALISPSGYGVLRFRRLRSIPRKLLIGYSDTTILHELWPAGVPSIHARCVRKLGEEPATPRLQHSLRELLRITWTHGPRAPVARRPLARNLATLASMCAPAAAAVRGSSSCSRPQRAAVPARPSLTNPPHSALDGAKAFVIGDLTAPARPAGREEVVAEVSPASTSCRLRAPFARGRPASPSAAHALDAQKAR